MLDKHSRDNLAKAGSHTCSDRTHTLSDGNHTLSDRTAHSRRSDRNAPSIGTLVGRGALAGLVAGVAMDTFGQVVRLLRGGREAAGAAAGAHRGGRGAQPPQAKGRAEEDAAVHVGTAAYRLLTGA